MKVFCFLIIAIFFLSFRPTSETSTKNSNPGYYVFVEDFTNRSYNKFIVESKDSVGRIFKNYFDTELKLGDVRNPIFINNGDYSFYIARVNVFENAKGKKTFRHLKYPKPKQSKRAKLKPVTL